ncbi:focadhesin [Eupeodes corollae]|uniref:focadhesin n=1 Tax=Eupeodes corollae TaxID=290404 RepID=UPI00248FDD26|nr:focadhesin [Eupeodes corollae]
MDEFKSVTKNSSVVKISALLEKIYAKICESKEKKVLEHNIKEIEFLKTQCKSDIIQLSLMSSQTFVRLVESGILDVNNVLVMLISMLPNSSSSQHSVISESVISLLLLSLKRKAAQVKDNEPFQSTYGLKTQQHPLITLIQNKGVDINDIANKINGICNHQDKQIKKHSTEYLRPVFLYILCNPETLPYSKTIWTGLLALAKTQTNAKHLTKEIILWSKISSTSTSLFTSIILIEAVDHYLAQKDFDQAIDLAVYQAVVIQNLAGFGIDPRPSLQSILRVLHSTREHNQNFYNVLLILLARNVHILSPIYLPDLLRLIAYIVVQENCGNQYILNMCLDGIILWMSQTAFIPTDGVALAHQIVKKIISLNKLPQEDEQRPTISTKELSKEIKNIHPDVAIAFDLAKLVESFDESEFKDVFTFVDALNVKAKSNFCQSINLFLRALFLSREPSMDCWFRIYEIILEIIKINGDIAYDFLMTYVFKLAEEVNPEIQIELLRGLPNFGVSKDNIPMILNTIRAMNIKNPTFCMDLYLRLWRIEGRTYPFLKKLLSQPHKELVGTELSEFEITKTHTIKEICSERPNQYGSDLVSHLSDTLNSCTDKDGDLATSLALDAIISLCESHTVNIVSTWKALSGKFRHETRPRTLKSLLQFFAQVPLLQTPTLEYENLVEDALDNIWKTICISDNLEIIQEAFKALTHFEINTLMTLRHIPPIFRDFKYVASEYEYNQHTGREIIDLQNETIPGDCWIQVLQRVRPECTSAVADLLSHYIYQEINGYRSGVYRIPEGKPEPRKIQVNDPKSVLRAVLNYLVSQSRFGDRLSEPHVVTNALRAISQKFPKPIPPLDWCFLHSFFHLNFETRKYCILIAKNQILHSGTARRLLENFLTEFEPNCFEKDLLLLFNVLPEIANGVSLQIIKNFTEKIAVYCFKESQLNGFAEGCLFEKFLDSAKYIFTGKCDIPEVLDVYTLIIERYMDSMDIDSKLFEKYTEVLATMHPNSIDGLTSPCNWWEKPIGKLKKATLIRCYLVLYNDKLPNPLKWLNPIIDAFAEKPEEQTFLFRHLAATLYAFNNDECSCAWIMELFLQIQALLANSSIKEKLDKAFYMLDIFILAIDVLSGCAVLLGNLDVIATSRADRIEIFPESLQYLCDHIFWKDNEAKIYEFLSNLYRMPVITDVYCNIFREAIICSRNKPYFDNKAIWTKYVGMRK